MKKLLKPLLLGVILGAIYPALPLSAQDTLSQQVLRLLTRVSSWGGTQTFSDLRVANAAIPSITTYRIYADTSGNLYFNGGLIAGSGGGVTPHNLLSTTHADTVAASPVRGDVLIANSTPAWTKLAKCTAGYFVGASATDTVCSNDATQFVNVPAANLTGTVAAVSGVNLTALNATNLGSGTVPLARLSNIANAQIASGAAIAYSKLSLAASIVLTTDVTGILPMANGGTGLSTASDDQVMVNSGAAWVAKTVPDCNSTTSALGYTQSTNAFSCISVAVGTGTVTSVGLTMPAIFSVASSPVTASGTIVASLVNQSANLVWGGPSSGSAAAPSFRSLVSADIPVTMAAGSLSSSTPYGWTQTWNSGGTTFRGLDVTITDTASAAASTIFRLLGGAAGSTSEFSVSKAGTVLIAGNYTGAAGSSTLGTTAQPFASVIIGTAATNNFSITPAAFGQGVVATVDDPGFTAGKLDLLRRGSISYVGTSISAGTCDTPATATETGLASTAVISISFSAVPGAQWKQGLFAEAYATSNTINILVCNPTAGSLMSNNATFRYAAIVP